MQIDIITLFPNMFAGPFDESIICRAQDKSLVKIYLHSLRKWAVDEKGTVDDKPYGGGTGMLLRPEPIFNAVYELKKLKSNTENKDNNTVMKQWDNSRVILLDAGGAPYTQQKAEEYSKLDSLIFICGHYEGVDYRVHEHLADEVISIGDYIVTGGEIPAMAIIDSVVRLIPGVLEKEDATKIESFSDRHSGRLLVEFPQYTRPKKYKSYKVPDILLSGNHAKIEKWRKEQSEKRTEKTRSDLIQE